MFTKSIGTRVFYHASIASTQDAPDTNDEIKLENQLIHSNTLVDFDANSTSYSNPIHIFDGSTSHHWKQTTRSVEHI